MHHKLIPFALAASVFLLASCLKVAFSPPPNDSQLTDKQFVAKNLSETLIPVSQVPLFANLSEYNLSPQTPTTRAGEENSSDDVVSVESLLDREHTHTLPFENQVFIVTPFLQNKEPVYASIGEEALSDIRSASVVKKYYVEVSAEGFKIHYVVTMVTDLQYFQAHPDFDFLNKPNYSGAEFLSTVSGRLVKSSMYFDGLTVDARVLTEEEILSKDGEGVFFVNLFKTEPATRSRTLSFTIDLSVGLKPYGYDEWLEEQLGEDYIEIEDYIDDPAICTAEYIPPGGGSSFNRDWLNNYVELMEAEDTDMSSYLHICPQLYVSRSYTVSITSNLEEMEPYGNGVYSEGSTVNVGFTRTGIELHLLPLAPPMFVRWSGDLISHKQERVSFIATKNIHATGYFYDGSLDAVPCWDKIKGVMNPLRNMSVAATKSGSFYAGTYGYTRNAGKKKHAGLDLNASPGTPMFAMYSGIVHYLETRCKGTSEDRDYGNEFVIQTVINSDTLYIQYAHLDATTPIAINPETQETYKEGDHVSIGDLICYSGKTGNARGTDVPNKHLHLGVSTDWKKDHRKISWIDPLPYINGTINVDSIENNHGRVNSIKCD